MTTSTEPASEDAAPDARGIAKRSGKRTERCGHILVAEDYPVNQQVVCKHLKDAGYDVTIAEDGEKAVESQDL